MAQLNEFDPTRLPYVTASLPGVGGEIKRYDEDFVVEEIPRYPASGSGTHVYLLIEKRGLTTHAAIRTLAQALDKRTQDIGYAGLKDAHGVTRQMVSVEHVDTGVIERLDLPRMKVLQVDRHTNKIKLGHLAGNRFTIRIRLARTAMLERAQEILSALAQAGVPNYFGPQRFGVRQDNALIGAAVLRKDFQEALSLMLGRPHALDRSDIQEARRLFDSGDWRAAGDAWPKGFAAQARVCRALQQADGHARKAWRSVDHSLRKLYVSALQSELFNQVLARRVLEINRLHAGDVAWIHRNGACFLVEDASAEQPRCDAFELSPSGPLFGRKMKEPTGVPAAWESEVLAESGLSRDLLRPADGTKLDGARRPLRVPLDTPRAESGQDNHGPFLQLEFALPPGSYATSVTREVCKPDTIG